MIPIQMIVLAGVAAGLAGNLESPTAPSNSALGPKARFLSANSARHFAWWEGNAVSSGTSQNHLSERQPYSFSLRKYKKWPRPADIGELLSISSNDTMHFAWWIKEDRTFPNATQPFPRSLMVCAGPSNALGATRDWYWCRQPSWIAGVTTASKYDRIFSDLGDHFKFEQIRFITSNNKHHFLWYERKGKLFVFRGTSDQFDSRTYVECKLPQNVRPLDIIYMSSNDQMHFTFLKNGTYMAGSSDDLAKFRTGVRYDLLKLQGR